MTADTLAAARAAIERDARDIFAKDQYTHGRWLAYLELAEAVTRLVTPRGPFLPWWCTYGGCIGCGRDAELEGVAHAPGCPAAEVDAALAALAKDGAQ